MKYCISKLV